MAAAQINPFDQFFGADGAPLTGGYVYIGQANADPRQFPITVYYDAALTIPAVQPLRTNAGYISRNGSPALVYLTADYSLLVTDKKGVQIFYIASYSAVSGVPSTPFVEQTYQAFTTSGAAPAYVLTPTPAITQYKTNQRFNVTFNAAGTTGNNTLNINGLGIKNLKQYDSAGVKQPAVITNGMISDVEYDGTDMLVLDALPPVGFQVIVRQSVQFGPLTATSPPASALIPSTQIGNTLAAGVTLKHTTAATYYSVANGFSADGSPLNLPWIATSDLSVPNLPPSATSYIWVDVITRAAGFVNIADIDQPGGTIPVLNNQYTFDYINMKMFLGNGAAAVQSNRLIVAEVDTSATVVTAIRPRAYKREFEGVFLTPLPGLATGTSAATNLGTVNKVVSYIELECLVAEFGWAVGDRIIVGTNGASGTSANPLTLVTRKNTCIFVTGAGSAWIVTSSGGNAVTLTSANWKYRFVSQCNWGRS